MSFLLNIGVTRTSGIFTVMRAVRAAGLIQHQTVLHRGTLVLELSVSGAFTDETKVVTALAKKLKRDCIAYYHVQIDVGRLLGPKADAWGAFDPKRFVMPNGSKLAQEATT